MTKLNARECIINEIPKSDEIAFLEENHIQGYANSSIAYGLFYGSTLVQIMTFGKPRFNKYYQWELIRDCTKMGFEIIGGTSKIWKHFINKNTVRNCICYSYPHNGDYTNKYVDYCNFHNIKKAKPTKKIYFEGNWKGEIKRIDKSILERHGVDRLLKGSFGHDRTNEQILLDLGFEKKCEDGFTPQVDSYIEDSLVYKITDLETGKFYIGETTNASAFIEGSYNGSGQKWAAYFNKYKDSHRFKREILKRDFTTPKELYDFETEEIRKYCVKQSDGTYKVDKSTGCMNVKTTPQSYFTVCSECGAILGSHKKTCSHFNKENACEFCGTPKGGHHKADCPNAKLCPECGHHPHLSTCSRRKAPKVCPECGSRYKHKKTCSKYVEPKSCPECGGKYGKHKKGCSLAKPCPECGTLNGHSKGCSKYNRDKVCEECGGKDGKHKSTCSKYKRPKLCPECGGRDGHHKKSCSKTSHCHECGMTHGHHKPTCSKNKIDKE